MKINSILGKMTGKIGNLVVTSVNGEVIGREYNPNVANPNTVPQQNTRTKFKLASQLSATMAPVIAIKKEGNVSARNQFVKANFPSISYNNGQANINLNVVQLTKSQRPLVGFNADRSGGSAISVKLNADSAAQLSRVVYIGYKKLADGTLQLFDSKVCKTAGDDGLFSDVLRYVEGAVVLYAYGMKDLESGITSKFGNMQAPTAEEVASLLVSNTENMSSVQLTKTAGLTMGEGDNTGDSASGTVPVTITVSTNMPDRSTVAGGGQYVNGDEVTVTATANQGEPILFNGWYEGNTKVSDDRSYTFTATGNRTLEARWTSED